MIKAGTWDRMVFSQGDQATKSDCPLSVAIRIKMKRLSMALPSISRLEA